MKIAVMTSMQTVKVSKRYQVVIPEELRKEAGIRPGDRMVVIMKSGVLQYVRVGSISESKGMVKGLTTKNLRDVHERF